MKNNKGDMRLQFEVNNFDGYAGGVISIVTPQIDDSGIVKS